MEIHKQAYRLFINLHFVTTPTLNYINLYMVTVQYIYIFKACSTQLSSCKAVESKKLSYPFKQIVGVGRLPVCLSGF